MERVQGIGGIFLKARDPVKLKAWYAKNLGVPLDKHGYVVFENRSGGQTVWSPFPSDTKYFRPSKAAFMVNFRVRNLARMLAQLEKARCQVIRSDDPDTTYGRFAWVVDPEGNKVELWEPPRPARARRKR